MVNEAGSNAGLFFAKPQRDRRADLCRMAVIEGLPLALPAAGLRRPGAVAIAVGSATLRWLGR